MTCPDVTKSERSQRQFVALCQYRFFTYDHVTYEDFLKFLNFYTLHNSRLYLNAFFFISVYSGLKCSPTLLDIRGLPRTFSNSSLCKCSIQDMLLENKKVIVLGSGMFGVCSSGQVTFAPPCI